MTLCNWKSAVLADHCEIFSGYAFPSAGFTDDETDVHLVKGENIGQGEVLWDISKRWPKAQFADLHRFQLVTGDVVLAMDRPWVPAGLKFAQIGLDAPEALVVQRVARLRARQGMAPDFLPCLIASADFESYIQNAVRGVTVPHISANEIGAFSFLLPPIQVQYGIGQLRRDFDDLIANNRRRIQLLEDSVRLLFDEWFVRLNSSGHASAATGPGLPAGWSKLPLEEVLVLQRGFDLPSQDREAGEVPIYGSTGIVGFHNKAKVAGPGIVTGRSGTLGEVHFIRGDFWPLNTALWVKEFRRVTPLFALHLLRGMNLRQYNGGVSVPTLDRKVVHRAEVLLPPERPMQAFEAIASDVRQQIDTLNRMNDKLRTARDLLLPRLMSGELTV